MKSGYIQISGDFDRFDPLVRYETHQELSKFLEREHYRFNDYHLHAHIKQLNNSLGKNPLIRCTLGLHTNKGRFNVSEEAFGVEAAVKSGLMDLRYQVEKHFEKRIDNREKVTGRKAPMLES